MAKNINAEPFTEETLTKLDIFDNYLTEWLPVTIRNPYIQNSYVFDFFAADIEGRQGSPLIFLDVIKNYKDQLRNTNHKVHLMLNEYDKTKIDNLKKLVFAKSKELNIPSDNLSISYEQKDFAELFDWCCEQNGFINSFNLLILDQNGIKQITKDILCRIDKLKKRKIFMVLFLVLIIHLELINF